MEDKTLHSKVINQICKEVLVSIGLFQKGTSRIYLDDNDYFFTVVEFQPSSWEKGTYLNIGLTFLWEHDQPDTLTFEFSRQVAGRYGEFVRFENEMQFRNEVTNLAQIAKEEVLFYRKLRDIHYAKKWMIGYVKKFKKQKFERFGVDISNICILDSDKKMAEFYYKEYLKTKNIEMQIYNYELNKEHLEFNIKSTREMWHSKSSMKKMPISRIYDI